jgi:hypothetical protein
MLTKEFHQSTLDQAQQVLVPDNSHLLKDSKKEEKKKNRFLRK